MLQHVGWNNLLENLSDEIVSLYGIVMIRWLLLGNCKIPPKDVLDALGALGRRIRLLFSHHSRLGLGWWAHKGIIGFSQMLSELVVHGQCFRHYLHLDVIQNCFGALRPGLTVKPQPSRDFTVWHIQVSMTIASILARKLRHYPGAWVACPRGLLSI